MVMSPDINIVEVKDVEVPASDCILSKYSTTLSLFVTVCERIIYGIWLICLLCPMPFAVAKKVLPSRHSKGKSIRYLLLSVWKFVLYLTFIPSLE